ncbi:MAG TPA: hypothetical protein VHD90_19035 [Phototrophicaceae bacterium]|nr:hypothetical protein [Phototrophicaceae bacterium]
MTQDATTERREIEKRMMDSTQKLLELRFNPTEWLDSQALKTFSEALYELVQFHEWHGEIRDTVVGFEGIQAYLTVTGLLRDMLRDEANSELREKMSETLDHIEILLQKIIAEGYSKMYWDEENPSCE